jgi:hypothetical protein
VTYSINVSGHKDTLSEEESREFETAALEKARTFVAELEGVTSASFSGGSVGGHDLTAAEED